MPIRTNAAPTPGLQLTWLDGEVVAWQPGRGVYGGNLQAAVRSTFGRPQTAPTNNMRVVRMALPDGEQQVMCQRLTVASLAALGQLDALGSDVGASVGWLGAAYSVAMRLVTGGRVLPQLTDTGMGWWTARWRPLRADLAGPVAELAANQPPVVGVASPGFSAEELTTVIIDSFVDQTARLLLAGAGWHAPITDTRRLAARATARCHRAPSAHRQASSAPIPNSVRRSTIWRPCSTRPFAAPRANRSFGRDCDWPYPTTRWATGRCRWNWSIPTTAAAGALRSTSPRAVRRR